MREVERSLNRLDIDHIDVYLVHNFDESIPIEETARALDDLVHQGQSTLYRVLQPFGMASVQSTLDSTRIKSGTLYVHAKSIQFATPRIGAGNFPLRTKRGAGRDGLQSVSRGDC